MSMLELHLDEWEPISIENGFAIKNRKNGQILGMAKSLKGAILKARNKAIGRLQKIG